MAEYQGKEMDWDDSVEKGEGGEFILLPEGDYDYEIESFERGRFMGTDKTPPCNKAILKLRVQSNNGTAFVTENLLLYDKMQWKLAAFFLSIGETEVDGKVRMNWNIVHGATGRATFEVTTDRNDATKKYNHVKKFLPKEPKKFKAGEF